MKQINFEGLGIKLKVKKVAFTIFNKEIYWYAIFILAGIILALLFFKKKSKKMGINFEDVINITILTIPIGFIGARIYYCIFNIEYYKNNIYEIFNLRAGGIAIYGGLIAGATTILFYCRKKKIDFINLLDFLAPGVALAQSIGRWGNFFNIEAYGSQTNNILRMGIVEGGIYKQVHPTFFYESVLDLFIFILLSRKVEKRKYKGEIIYIYLVLYSGGRFFIEGLRQDSLMFLGLRVSQVLSAIIFVSSLAKLLSKKIGDS